MLDISSITAVEKKSEEIFDFALPFSIPYFQERTEFVPDVDSGYKFDQKTTSAILAGLAKRRNVLITGYHGTGKSSHIEQVCSRLNWPCVRINLDSHVSRIDLLGKDSIVLRDGKQVTEFKEGLLPWSISRPVALVFDEYDAGRPDVMFVIQRILESGGKLTLLEQNRVITPHSYFRLFATSNTIGMGDTSGLYHGTNPINQGQMDRWNIIVQLNYLHHEVEQQIVFSKFPQLQSAEGRDIVQGMVALAGLTRKSMIAGDLSVVMSPRTVLTWAENYLIFGSLPESFRLSYLNRVEESEQEIVAEYYQRCFGEELVLNIENEAA